MSERATAGLVELPERSEIEGVATRLRILQVNTSDTLGGAARHARTIMDACRSRGHECWLAVGQKGSNDPDVLEIPPDQWPGSLLRAVTRTVDREIGIEDYRSPGSWRLLELPPERPQVVHAHNLHGGYFDLRVLSWLSSAVPVLLTLHDAWLLSGHCAHSLACERWTIGCGNCPDLTLYPSVKRDATAFNWRRKQRVFRASKLNVAAPCRWLMEKVERSMLAPAVSEGRIIPNGVDLSVFKPAAADRARARLGIPADAFVLVFAAQSPISNMWKDFETVSSALDLALPEAEGTHLLLVVLGEDNPSAYADRPNVRVVPYQHDRSVVASYYQAADLYVHAARAETFPYAVIEALACGTPVVATGVGGIPEQVDHGSTGLLVPEGDGAGLASAVIRLLRDEEMRHKWSRQAAQAAARRFDAARQTDAYLAWYGELVARPAPRDAG